MMKRKILLAFLLIFIIVFIPIAAACSDNTETVSKTRDTESAVETGEERDTRFDNVDFEGREFRINTSVNTNDATNANALIEGTGEINGEPVNDAVYARNQLVEELLGIKLVFTQSDYNYGDVAINIRKLVLSADDAFELIINDLFPFTELTYEGMFVNVFDAENFDFTKTYWYAGYMEDLKLTKDRMYIMAGDYFMDVIGSAHTLFYNKNICDSMYGDPDLIYDHVIDGSWTFDKLIGYLETSYMDLNGDSQKNEGDQFGFAAIGTWGSMIPFVISADIRFIDRGEDYSISFAFKNERSVTLLEKLNEIFHNNGTIFTLKDQTTEGLRALFAANQSLFVGYQRLGYLELMRGIEFEIGVVPYPKLNEEQKTYVTSSHDTTEIGVIPITSTDFGFVTTVIEVLNRETASMVIPEYYETALKVKYTRDEVSAMMIDIIHDNFGVTFPLAYNTSLNSFLLTATFSTPLTNKSTDFMSNYDTLEGAALSKLETMVETLIEKTS